MLKLNYEYTGDFVAGKKHGKGSLKESSGVEYLGDFF